MKIIDTLQLSKRILDYLISDFGVRWNYCMFIPRIDLASYSIISFVPEIFIFRVKPNGWEEEASQSTTNAPIITYEGLKTLTYQVIGESTKWNLELEFVSSIIKELEDFFSFLPIAYTNPSEKMKDIFKQYISAGSSFAFITNDLRLYSEVSITGRFSQELDSIEDAGLKLNNMSVISASLNIKEITNFKQGF